MSESWFVEVGKYGPRMVATGPWTEAAAEFATAQGICELELNYAKGWTGPDISFLESMPHLVALDVAHLQLKDVTPVNGLPLLRYLGIHTYCKSELKFSNWPDMEEVALDEWRPKAASLFRHPGIRRVFLSKWSQGEDLSSFAEMRQLQKLQIYSSSRLRSLGGVEQLGQLRHLEIAGATRLASLQGLQALTDLQYLELHTCRRVADIGPIAHLQKLKDLLLCNCGGIESFRPLLGLKSLESVIFYESTDVLDGDLSPLRELPNLRSVAFMERAHYSLGRADLPA